MKDEKHNTLIRMQHTISGQVQGVGFRPFIFTLAERYALTGSVSNTAEGVEIEVQGDPCALGQFDTALKHTLPPLAKITAHRKKELALIPTETQFCIKKSKATGTHSVLVSPDTAVCADCTHDMETFGNRRYMYPFTNCTNCGPRYTITSTIPYDRKTTSMSCFALCDNCRAEYENPRDRRFHAQPNACPICGPKVWFCRSGRDKEAEENEAFLRLANFLAEGGIVAIKGLGGFHLACDATNAATIAKLRGKKQRPHKPLALMTDSLETAQTLAVISEQAKEILLSAEHPIVLCPQNVQAQGNIPFSLIAPDTPLVGLMLPYTPLHHVLLWYYKEALAKKGIKKTPVLVMTSGNKGGEPICLGNREARERLSGIAEAFLFHNRDILIRVDDSVVMPLPEGKVLFFRRARGYVPSPTLLPKEDNPPCVLGVGAELKNTLCLTRGNNAFVSQHIGDMSNVETESFHREITSHFKRLLSVSPSCVVRDKHPDYLSSRLADQYGIPVYPLQHHAAHGFAVLGETGFSGKALVLALDGTGYGDDGGLWGGEAFWLNTATAEYARVGSLSAIPLPGGEAAIRQPWRIAHALLCLNKAPGYEVAKAPWLPLHKETARIIPQMLEKKLNTPFSTSCGRLFDAVSALLGICHSITYEGQAAIKLEQAQYPVSSGGLFEVAGCHDRSLLLPVEDLYKMPIIEQQGRLVLDSSSLVLGLWYEFLQGTPVYTLSKKFHQSLAQGFVALAARLCAEHAVTHVGLSGGCFYNLTLLFLLQKGLKEKGLIPITHNTLPPGDGCISYGQAFWGRCMAMQSKLIYCSNNAS